MAQKRRSPIAEPTAMPAISPLSRPLEPGEAEVGGGVGIADALVAEVAYVELSEEVAVGAGGGGAEVAYVELSEEVAVGAGGGGAEEEHEELELVVDSDVVAG